MKIPFKILFYTLCSVSVFSFPAYSQVQVEQGVKVSQVQDALNGQGVNLLVKMWVENTADEFIRALALQNTDSRFAHLRNIFRTNVDINYIARKVVGRSWRNFDENIRERYIAAFENYMLYVYAAKPVNLNVTNFMVTGTKQIGSSANITIASAVADFTFNEDGLQQPRVLDFAFTLSQNGSDFKILDVSVGGISAVNFVSNFYSAQLQKNRGDAYYTLRQLEAEIRDIQLKNTVGDDVESPFPILSEPASQSPTGIQPTMMYDTQ